MLYKGESVGANYCDLESSRLRFLGGSTNHWAGWCRPLDPIDFQQRSAIPDSGWPITRTDLDPFYARAQQVCELGAPTYDTETWTRATGLKALSLDERRLRTAIFQISPPTRFGPRYEPELKTAASVSVYLHANVTELETDASGGTVVAARAAVIDGPRFSVVAKLFVLAAGGMENVRLLLLSNRVHDAGLGNGADLVGRYFMDHPWLFSAGVVQASRPPLALPLYFTESEVGGTRIFGTLVPAETLMRDEGLGNFRVVLRPATRIVHGVDSLKAIGHALGSFSWPDRIGEHLANILDDMDSIADATYKSVFRTRTGLFRSSNGAGGATVGAVLDVNAEYLPNRDSRLTLSHERDFFGQNRLALDWRPGAAERRTMARALELTALEFGRLGIGRTKVGLSSDDKDWPVNLDCSRHHMGGTRMSADAKRGVVDANCRMHAVANLYVAGSSVFPTCGYANPTLTIVALALRLAEEMRIRLS
jgi:choline dehydrogenase-like flavoprotein